MGTTASRGGKIEVIAGGRSADFDTALTQYDKRIESERLKGGFVAAHTAILGMLWRVLESCGIEPSAIVPAELYRPAALLADDSYVPLADYYAILGAVIEAVDDEAVGIRMAGLIHPSHLGVFGHAWIASPSLIAGCRMLARYGRVVFRDLPLEYRETPAAIEVAFAPEGT
jgi:hypothetical protein